MSCSGCGNSSCSGCRDISVTCTAVGISSVADNGDGTTTITLDNGATTVITPTATPNDAWVEEDEASIAPTYRGTATNNGLTYDLTYKVMNIDTVVILFHADINATFASPGQSMDFEINLGNITSNWYAGNKKIYSLFNSIQSGVPVFVRKETQPVADNYVAQAYANNGILYFDDTEIQDILPGTYDFDIDFQITCKLLT